MRKRLLTTAGAVAAALIAVLAVAVVPAAAQGGDETPRVMIYTGTTGFRHADAINNGRPVVQAALEKAGYAVDWEDCTDNGGNPGNCDYPTENPRVFSDRNLLRYDAVLLLNASSSWAGGGKSGPLWNERERAAIIRFVQRGGGIAANHNATDMGAGVVTWDWWDGGQQSVVGTLMRGHARTDLNNLADVHVEDPDHLSTITLPPVYQFGDEHYNFFRSVRDTHHVLLTLDESSYDPGPNAMGADHPITWCKRYNGPRVVDGTGVARPYYDGRTWVTGMGHFGASYTANGGDNELVRQIVGGVRWVAGEGGASDCAT
jgi:trehalose utilization protein